MLAPQVAGAQIETLEGITDDGTLHPIQQAFVEHNAFQCSYCTPGFVLAVRELLATNPAPTHGRDARLPVGQPVPLRLIPEDPRGGRRRSGTNVGRAMNYREAGSGRAGSFAARVSD